jgi:hypothetical protein
MCRELRLTIRLLQQPPHLLVARLRKILVPAADGAEVSRCEGADDLVSNAAEFGARFRCRHRNRHDHSGRLQPAQCGYRRAHGRARGQAIVDQDHGPAAHFESRGVVAVQPLAPVQFTSLLLGNSVDDAFRDAERSHHVVIHEANAAAGDGAHCQFLVPRYAEFAHHEDIQWSMQRTRHLERNRDAATRQRQHQHVLAAGECLQLGRQ